MKDRIANSGKINHAKSKFCDPAFFLPCSSLGVFVTTPGAGSRIQCLRRSPFRAKNICATSATHVRRTNAEAYFSADDKFP